MYLFGFEGTSNVIVSLGHEQYQVVMQPSKVREKPSRSLYKTRAWMSAAESNWNNPVIE